jgi:hypothetical protein
MARPLIPEICLSARGSSAAVRPVACGNRSSQPGARARQRTNAARAANERHHSAWQLSSPEIVQVALIGVVATDLDDPSVLDSHELTCGHVEPPPLMLGCGQPRQRRTYRRRRRPGGGLESSRRSAARVARGSRRGWPSSRDGSLRGWAGGDGVSRRPPLPGPRACPSRVSGDLPARRGHALDRGQGMGTSLLINVTVVPWALRLTRVSAVQALITVRPWPLRLA